MGVHTESSIGPPSPALVPKQENILETSQRIGTEPHPSGRASEAPLVEHQDQIGLRAHSSLSIGRRKLPLRESSRAKIGI